MELSDAYIVLPNDGLDRLYRASCDCGWSRDFGRMAITCERETERHRGKGEAHNVTVVITETSPLSSADIRARLRNRPSRTSKRWPVRVD